MIIYKEQKNIDIDQLFQLYQSVGWSFYSKEVLSRAYQNAMYVFSAWDKDCLIGVIRVIGDGVTILYIQDLIVRQSYQRQKIATTLINYILERYAAVYQIVLLTDDQPSTVAFYEYIGMKRAEAYGCVSFVQFHRS